MSSTGSVGQSKEPQGSFVRWQSITLTQLGYVIGLLLSIATAMLGFAFTLIKDMACPLTCCEKVILSSALFLLTLSIALALSCTINRLCDFRETEEIAHD